LSDDETGKPVPPPFFFRIAVDEEFPELIERTPDSDPMILWGCWPGEEPLEKLMALFD
jgi:hypothetical protein